MPRRYLKLLVALGVLLVVSTGCRVDATVLIEVSEDQSGQVTVEIVLDPEAAGRVPDLADELAASDLEEAGWTLDGPESGVDGSMSISATKPFGTLAEARDVLAEVAGSDGPLSDVVLASDHPFGRTLHTFSATLDLSGGLATFSDDQLAELLGGDPFGGVLSEIEAETGAPPEEQASLTVDVRLPGASRSWTVEPGDEAQELRLESSEIRPLPWALAGMAALSFAAGVLVLGFRAVRAVARPRRGSRRAAGREQALPEDATEAVARVVASVAATRAEPESPAGSEPTRARPDAEHQPQAPQRKLRLVVLDVMGTVLATGPSTVELLTRFVQEHGGVATPERVLERYSAAAEGRLTVGELWRTLGVEGDPGDLSDEFLALHRLVPGVREFLERMRRRGLPVACVANDVAEWSRRVRSTHRLDPLTVAWLVSGDLGERLPAPALLDRMTQITGVRAADTLFITSATEHLEAGRDFGYAVAWFSPPGAASDEAPARAPVIHSFADLGIGSS